MQMSSIHASPSTINPSRVSGSGIGGKYQLIGGGPGGAPMGPVENGGGSLGFSCQILEGAGGCWKMLDAHGDAPVTEDVKGQEAERKGEMGCVASGALVPSVIELVGFLPRGKVIRGFSEIPGMSQLILSFLLARRHGLC